MLESQHSWYFVIFTDIKIYAWGGQKATLSTPWVPKKRFSQDFPFHQRPTPNKPANDVVGAAGVGRRWRYWYLDSNEEVSAFRGSANANYQMSGQASDQSDSECSRCFLSKHLRCFGIGWSWLVWNNLIFFLSHGLYFFVSDMAWQVRSRADQTDCRMERSGWSFLIPWRWEGPRDHGDLLGEDLKKTKGVE